MEFGQCILYKVSMKVKGGDMEARWEKGMWLGKRFATEEHIVSTAAGVVARCSAVRAHPDIQYDSHLFDALIGLPWDPAGKNKTDEANDPVEEVRDLPRVVVARGEDMDIPKVRRMHIDRDMISRFGPTPGCPKCVAIRIGDNSRPALGHSSACRTRIEGKLSEDPVLARKLQKAKEREDEYLARRIEAGDVEAKRARVASEAEVELVPGPGGASESRIPDRGTHSRAPSTVSYTTDVPAIDEPDDVDVPIPNASLDSSAPSAAASSSVPASSSSPKRKHEGPAGDEGRGDEVPDPEDPSEEMGMCCEEVPSVLMLGEKRHDSRVPGHPGKYEVCELFSPQRVSAAASKQGLRGGWSLDIEMKDPVTGYLWDLTELQAQSKVWRMLRRDKPLVVGLSPPCTLFSALQNLRKSDIPVDELEKAMACVKFCVEVAEYQMARGRFFYFEHPLTATSWTMPELDGLRSRKHVEDVTVHMCAFGLDAEDAEGVGLVKKPTRILTNMPSIATALDRRCSGDHRHVHLVSGRAKGASKYSEEFCASIVDGIQTYLAYMGLAALYGAFEIPADNRLEDSSDALYSAELDEYMDDGIIPFSFSPDGYCVDDVRGGTLPLEWVKEGRRSEMEGFGARKVYEIRPRVEATSKGARVVGVRWVDTLKGDKVRSRLVAQDFNNDRVRSDEMFAATPPLVASRYLVSRMASQQAGGLGDLRLMALDFSKAFLYGDMQREVYIELPDEDLRKFLSDCVGLLKKSMYGLRDAPLIWQQVVREMLEARGFVQLIGTQCTYAHLASGMLIVAHVDDFLVLGRREELVSLRDGLKSEGYDCSGDILGPGPGDVSELKFLGRTIRLTADGIEWEADKRHATAFIEKLLQEFGPDEVEYKGRQLSGVKTPGVKRTEVDLEKEMLAKGPAKAYRGLAALGNYMSQDRPDTGFATKEISKAMANPCAGDIGGLKRLGRYLKAFPTCALLYGWQEMPVAIDGFADADWGGDLESRRSTSGGCILHGSHVISFWSRTQHVIALSSAESELHALSACASEGLGIKLMCMEMGIPMELNLSTDSSAARGIVQRQGAGRVKHLDIKTLWLQERENVGDFAIIKIPRIGNWSDLLTHHWSEIDGTRHLVGLNCLRR